MHFVIFFPCFLIKFYVIFTKFLEMSATWKYVIKFSYLVRLNFISIHDGWNSLSLYQYMSWAGAGRTPMTIWTPIKALISPALVEYQFLFGAVSNCFCAYSFVWVAISINNASGNIRLKKSNSRLLFSEQSYKGKVKTKYINRQNQSTTGKLKTVTTLTWYRHF